RRCDRRDPWLHSRRRPPRRRKPVEGRRPGDRRSDATVLPRHTRTALAAVGRARRGAAANGGVGTLEQPLLLGRAGDPGRMALIQLPPFACREWTTRKSTGARLPRPGSRAFWNAWIPIPAAPPRNTNGCAACWSSASIGAAHGRLPT